MLGRAVLGADLHQALVMRYADTVMRLANVPAARREDLEDAPRFSASEDEIACTCGITGATYIEKWDGTAHAAMAFAGEVGETTAGLVARTKKNHHYAWLYSAHSQTVDP
ncbi:MAG: hypothetical protein ACRDKK_05670 [Gaiellaceae bacterium]